MHGILASFNEYQSRESGADIAYKMGQKARNGGTIGRARLGYLNHIDRADGRDIRTIMVDPERAPLIQLGFELFAIGNLTLDQLSQRLYERGLRTRPTARYPAQQVSISKLARMLRDRYYLGYVAYRGEEVRGRHKPHSSTSSCSTGSKPSSTPASSPESGGGRTITTLKAPCTADTAITRATADG